METTALPSDRPAQPPTVLRMKKPVSPFQGWLIILLLLVLLALLGFLAWSTLFYPRWEYKVQSYVTEGNERTGTEAMKYASIQIKPEELAQLGADGWEMVGSYLEMETAFPNFGDSQYVTGIQPNIRPQEVVFIFKRRKPLF